MAVAGLLQLGLGRSALVWLLRSLLSALSRVSVRRALADGLPDCRQPAVRLCGTSGGKRRTRAPAIRAGVVGCNRVTVVVRSADCSESRVGLWITFLRHESGSVPSIRRRNADAGRRQASGR